MVTIYTKLWQKGNTVRYYVPVKTGGKEIQIGKYRGQDDFDKAMKIKAKWHNKWYVDNMTSSPKLFNTQKEAKKYFLSYVKKYGVQR